MKKTIITTLTAGVIAFNSITSLAAVSIKIEADNSSYSRAYELDLNSSVSDSLFPKTNEEDWYKITLSKDGTLSVGMVSDNAEAYAYLYLFDRNASQRIADDSGRDQRLHISKDLQAGEYYIRVSCSDSMGYTLDNQFEAQTIANDPEDRGTYQSANTISFGQTKTGHLGYISDTKVKDENDWYVFTLNAQAEINIGLVGNTSAYMYLKLYDENGDKRIKDSSGRDKQLTINQELEAGTYYIRVDSSDAVGYTLSLDSASESTDSIKVTEEVPIATKQPTISNKTEINENADNTSYNKAYELSLDSSISDSLFPKTNEEDWYKITLPEDGTLSVGMVADNAKAYAYLYLLDRNASQRIADDSGKDQRLHISKDLQAGEYYIRVSCSDSMGYTLDNQFEAQTIANDPEDRGTYQSANTISFGQTKTGHLGYISDTKVKNENDWYVFTLNAQAEINIGLVGNTSAYMYLKLYDENGDKRIKDSSGRDKQLTINQELEAGTYYIRVDSSDAVGYTLSLDSASGRTDSVRVTEVPTEKPTIAYETETKDQLNVKGDSKSGLTVDVNGKIIWFADALPFIDENNRTQIPIRAVAEAMGCTVEWDDLTQTVTITKNNISVKIVINKKNIQVGNETITMDTTAKIVNNRTYIPVRFVGEALGMVVNWIAQ